jgi:hypothetical protein
MPADFLNRRFNFQYREKIFNKLLVDSRSVIDSDPPVVYDRKAREWRRVRYKFYPVTYSDPEVRKNRCFGFDCIYESSLIVIFGAVRIPRPLFNSFKGKEVIDKF